MVTRAVAKTAAARRRPGRTWWLIVRDGPCGRLELLDIGGGWALPVFSFREEAEMFLHLGRLADGRGWRVRESGAGEVASVLCGPCRGAKSVALDPLPGTFGDEPAAPVEVDRERFLGELLRR